MKTELILVGKTRDGLYQQAIDDYRQRICHYMPFDITVIPEMKATKSLSMEQQKVAEGKLILSRIEKGDTLVLLDEHGKELTSVELADWLQKKKNSARRLVLVIGGPYGFSQDVYQRAQERLSLSRLTFSHQMVRLIFAEQLYRACTIINGEPYHHI